MSDINLKKLSQKNECNNKHFALGVVFFALLLSCGLICAGLCKYSPEEPIIAKTLETKELSDQPASDTACCMLSHKVERMPVEITETDYDNTTYVLLYVSIMIFMFLSLGGAFAILLKVLKSEHEINSKILDVRLEIHKVEQTWELTKEKKEYEQGSKDKELDYKKREFEELEKVKTEFEAGLKEREKLQGKDKVDQNDSREPKDGAPDSK